MEFQERKKQLFLYGFRKTLPFQTGVVPFGLLYATLATNAGFSWWMVLLFSVVVFAGSSQLIFIDLFSHLSSALQAVLGSNVVNTRHLIYSAGVSQEFSVFSKKWRLILSYLLTDQLYAFSEVQKKELQPNPATNRPWAYFGSGFCTWIFWLASSGAGIFFGQLIPASLNLEFAIPLLFMPMLMSACKNRFGVITSILSVVFILLFQKLPYDDVFKDMIPNKKATWDILNVRMGRENLKKAINKTSK